MQIEVRDPKESTIIVVELSVGELEDVIAPGLGIALNHNETLASDEIELDVE